MAKSGQKSSQWAPAPEIMCSDIYHSKKTKQTRNSQLSHDYNSNDMKRRLRTPVFFFLLIGWSAQAQFDAMHYRTIDGIQNNLNTPNWGAVGDNLQRMASIGYADGIATPGGTDRPNPRAISNAIFAQSGIINDPFVLSDFFWVWGQFLDHDFGLTPDSPEFLPITVPRGDPLFDPFNTGSVVIPMNRNVSDPSTGTAPGNPRQHPNLITAFIDGSGVYGSEDERATWLRTFVGGKLKVSEGNLLPYNTLTGQYDSPVSHDAPEMDDPVALHEKHFVAGDVRANENPLLAAMHTVFVREHNLLCDEFAKKYPTWNDEQLYQHARKYVSGYIQAIVYEEWLPAMGVHLPPYEGYKPDVNPQLANLFTAAAFRMGHTLLNGNLMRVDDDGNTIPEGNMLLRDAFFNPFPIRDLGLEPFFKGMAVQTQQQFDNKVMDDVRNFLFGPPGAGGLDLAAININRGRERGLPDFNTLRQDLGLAAYTSFSQINTNPQAVQALEDTYGDVDKVDVWVGLLSETPMPGTLFGETLLNIMQRQFVALRDGDRFYYENDPVLTEEEKTHIKKARLHYVIMRNTGITLMQDEVFKSIPHSEVCDNLHVNVIGKINTEHGQPVANAATKLNIGASDFVLLTDTQGNFNFNDVRGCDVRAFDIEKDDHPLNGVSTFDLVVLRRHILGVAPFDTPYKYIAADVDGSGNVSIADLLEIRKVILSVTTAFPIGKTWRFVPADYEFANPNNPFNEDMPEKLDFDLMRMDMFRDFVGIKLGDLDGSWSSVQNAAPERREAAQPLALQITDVTLRAGELYEIPFRSAAFGALAGYQFALQYDAEALEFVEAKSAAVSITADNFGGMNEQGILTTSWVGDAQLRDATVLFTLTFRAKRNGKLSEILRLNQRYLAAEAYTGDLQTQPIELSYAPATAEAPGLVVYQNRPNPVTDATVIPFELPQTGQARLTIFDLTGRMLFTQAVDFEKGYNEFIINRSDLGTSGVLLYKVETDQAAVTKRMLMLE